MSIFIKRENFMIVAAKVAEKVYGSDLADHEFAPKMCFRWGQCHYKAEKFAQMQAGVFDLFVTKKFLDDGLTCSVALSGQEKVIAGRKKCFVCLPALQSLPLGFSRKRGGQIRPRPASLAGNARPIRSRSQFHQQ